MTRETAVGYALLFHAAQIVPVTLVGWLFLLREHVTLREAARSRAGVLSSTPRGSYHASILPYRFWWKSGRQHMAPTPPARNLGWSAPDFELMATDGRRHRRDALRGPRRASPVS